MENVKLIGRVLIYGEIEAKTGLHIGGSPGALAIGNVDMPVIRDIRTNQPYIPGSSIKGKMRSLSEKWSGAPQNKPIGKDVSIHVAGGDRKKYPKGEEGEKEYIRVGQDQYAKFWVNPLFGIPGEVGFKVPAPNRLVVRDIQLAKDSVDDLLNKKTDLPFSEVKWEAAIDRVTSAATPRQIERVPAGAIFGPMELVFNVFLKEDIALLGHLLTAMRLVEDDYLGGQGSRGSGKIAFRNLSIELRHGEAYTITTDERFTNLPEFLDLWNKKGELLEWVSDNLKLIG